MMFMYKNFALMEGIDVIVGLELKALGFKLAFDCVNMIPKPT